VLSTGSGGDLVYDSDGQRDWFILKELKAPLSHQPDQAIIETCL
jgi:hypothetical protein